MMPNLTDLIQMILDAEGLTENLQRNIISSVVIIIVLGLLRWGVIWIINYEVEDVRHRYSWKKTANYLIAVLGIILVGRIWVVGIQSAATFLGLASAGVAIALQGPLTNLAGWFFILWRRPFEVGDRLEIRDYAGDVVDISLFQFTMLEIGNWVHADQSTGRIVHVPNRLIFTNGIFNYTQGFEYIWHEIPVLITFESNWEKAKGILQEILDTRFKDFSMEAGYQVRRASRRYFIKYPTLTPIVYTTVEESGVMLTARYICAVRRRRSSEQTLWEDILRAFGAEPDIEFAYPTQRFYTHGSQKSEGAVTFNERRNIVNLGLQQANHVQTQHQKDGAS